MPTDDKIHSNAAVDVLSGQTISKIVRKVLSQKLIAGKGITLTEGESGITIDAVSTAAKKKNTADVCSPILVATHVINDGINGPDWDIRQYATNYFYDQTKWILQEGGYGPEGGYPQGGYEHGTIEDNHMTGLAYFTHPATYPGYMQLWAYCTHTPPPPPP